MVVVVGGAVEEEDVVVVGGVVEEDVVAAVVPEQAETTSTRPTHQAHDLAYLTRITAARHSNLFHRHSPKGENPHLVHPNQPPISGVNSCASSRGSPKLTERFTMSDRLDAQGGHQN